MKTGEGGLLQVCMEGVGLLFANSKVSGQFIYFISPLFATLFQEHIFIDPWRLDQTILST